ncbi:MAG: alpha/beta hydrolase [Thermoflexales bacterium]|nr:alpha/beta hydrolase [Thermoflexales bacterium]
MSFVLAPLTGLLTALTLLQAVAIVARLPGLLIATAQLRPAAVLALLASFALAAALCLVATAPGDALPLSLTALLGLGVGFPVQLGLATLAVGRERGALSWRIEAVTRAEVAIPVALPDRRDEAAAPIPVASFVIQREAVNPAGANGLRLPATWVAPMAPVKTVGVVLLVCGAGDTRRSFKAPLVRALARHGLATLSIDPPGHGAFQTVPTTVANTQAAARAALAWLREAHPELPTGAIGISFGGCQVAWLAGQTPDLSAVVLISTPIRLPTVRRRTIVQEGARLGLPLNLIGLRLATVGAFWREWRDMRGYVPGPASLYDMIAEYDSLARVRELAGRHVLVVHGTADRAVPFAHARQLAGAGGGELFAVRQATHLSVITRPEVNERIAGWLAAALAQPVRSSVRITEVDHPVTITEELEHDRTEAANDKQPGR